MTSEFFLVARLPLPPSVNNLYRTIPWTKADGKPSTRRVATAEYITFQKVALSQLEQAEIQDWSVIEHIREEKRKKRFLPLNMEVVCYLESLWKSDLDNRIKALQDTILCSFLTLNDTLVTDLNVKKRLGTPYCKVRLSFASDGGDEW